MDVRSRRVSLTHAWRGRRSRRSEISSSEEVGLWVGTSRLGVVSLAAAVLTLAAAFFFDFPAADLVAAVEMRIADIFCRLTFTFCMGTSDSNNTAVILSRI